VTRLRQTADVAAAPAPGAADASLRTTPTKSYAEWLVVDATLACAGDPRATYGATSTTDSGYWKCTARDALAGALPPPCVACAGNPAPTPPPPP
jgi:hypothetical protein